MPREKQIIPKWTYPHEEVYINDNSAVSLDEATTDASTLKYLAVFASQKGIDGKLIDIDSLTNYYRMFGKTNFARYGQPHLMPTAYLQNENVHAWCMRVMPKDATYSNSVLSLWYKEDEENQAFRIKFTTKSISKDDIAGLGEGYEDALSNRDVLIEVGSMLDGTAVDGVYVDDEGYTQIPLAVFTSAGRGKYGQNLRWRITPDQDYEKEFQNKFFIFEVLDVEEGVSVVQHNTATIIPNPAFENATFINDVIDDANDGERIMNIHIFDENVEALYDVYKAFCNKMLENDPTLEIKIPDLYTFDPFFGKELKQQQSKTPANQPFIKFTMPLTADIDTDDPDFDSAPYTATEVISIDNVAGNILQYGSDGAFDDPDPDIRQAAIEKEYVRAFSGDIDKLILSCRRIPVTALYDANYSKPVKVALTRLALHRKDTLLYLDTNIRDSLGTFEIRTMESDFTEIYEIVDEFEEIEDNWPVSINAHHYMIKEPSTGRRVTVTITYYLALTDPDYTRRNSENSIPRTGDNAVLSGHVKNSLSPAVDESDADIKQALTDARINYFEAVGENIFERATDHTYIKTNSDLGVEGNALQLFGFKRILENEFRARRNNITTPERRKDFREYLLAKYEYLKGHVFDSFDIKYKSNKWESVRNITHVYASVQFYPRGEITLIEIDVNPKTYKEDLEDE